MEGPVGFYATRSLQALNERQARRRVLAHLRREPEFQPPPPPRKRWFQRRAPRGLDMSGAAIRFVRVERIAQMPLSWKRERGAVWYRE